MTIMFKVSLLELIYSTQHANFYNSQQAKIIVQALWHADLQGGVFAIKWRPFFITIEGWGDIHFLVGVNGEN